MSLELSTFARELEVAGRLARSAGGLAMGYRGGNLEVELKKGNEPVTVADRGASDLIVGGLEVAFPGDVVISEESADDPRRRESERVWFVDPIDGTRDFINGSDGFCVLIGLAVGGRPSVGVIYHPPSAELIVAASASGAWLLPTAADPVKLTVSSVDDLKVARVIATENRQAIAAEPKLAISRSTRVGAIGLKLAIIAAGDRDLFFNPSSRSSVWDTCAPEIILSEAGGRISDIHGNPLDYSAEATRHRSGLLGSNGLVHDAASKRASPLLGKPKAR